MSLWKCLSVGFPPACLFWKSSDFAAMKDYPRRMLIIRRKEQLAQVDNQFSKVYLLILQVASPPAFASLPSAQVYGPRHSQRASGASFELIRKRILSKV